MRLRIRDIFLSKQRWSWPDAQFPDPLHQVPLSLDILHLARRWSNRFYVYKLIKLDRNSFFLAEHFDLSYNRLCFMRLTYAVPVVSTFSSIVMLLAILYTVALKIRIQNFELSGIIDFTRLFGHGIYRKSCGRKPSVQHWDISKRGIAAFY